MSTERPMPIERGPRQEDLDLSGQSFYFDNRSSQADEARERWDEKRIAGKLRGFVRCSDARLKTVGESVSLGNIAAALEPRASIISSRGIESFTVLSHFDGDTIKPGEMPTGCGGLAAKRTIKDSEQIEGIGTYISKKVLSEDPVIQALITAEKLAYASEGKPVLAATQDHLDYTIYPIAYFQLERGQMRSLSSVRNEDILKYNPERIYESGIPTIEERLLPEVLEEMLDENRKEITTIFDRYPDLKQLQKVQKPRMVLLSTDIRSARVRYPNLSIAPGSVFKVHIPREKVGEDVQVPEEDLILALNQLEYPISHSAQNHADTNKPFSNTDRVIFETGDIEVSRHLSDEALKKPWMKNWFRLEGRKIIMIQTNQGQTTISEEISSSK